MKKKPPPGPWPKLSETLDFHDPLRCQHCGQLAPLDTSEPLVTPDLTVWCECDEDDQPTAVFVALCPRCADRIIEPHPRLYKQMAKNEPAPGAMPICRDCPARDDFRCTSRLARFNGGPGMKYEPEGSMVHICRSPRRLSGWHYIASGPVARCSGKDAAEAAT